MGSLGPQAHLPKALTLLWALDAFGLGAAAVVMARAVLPGAPVNLTAAVYARMSEDLTLTGLLAVYGGEPAIFTTDPAPGDAVLPYIVAPGAVLDTPFDTKVSRGRSVWRDIRCYAPATGSAALVEQIAERVRVLFHRHKLEVTGHETIIADTDGPTGADEEDAYGRIVTVKLTALED
jgi:hypothetical protein